jgi:hypothetical protein
MNKHLKLVREFHDAFSLPQAAHGENVKLSEMDTIMHQALLMEEGSELFMAIKGGDMVEILTGMINLAYCALGAIAVQGADVLDRPVSWQHDGFRHFLNAPFFPERSIIVHPVALITTQRFIVYVFIYREVLLMQISTKLFKWSMTVKCPELVSSANWVAKMLRKFKNRNFLKPPI